MLGHDGYAICLWVSKATPWPVIDNALAAPQHVCRVEPLTVAVRARALTVAKCYGIPIHDVTIAASVSESGCRTL